MNVRVVGADLFHADGQTDIHSEAFRKHLKSLIAEVTDT